MSANTEWKALQRDWLIARLRLLISKWGEESAQEGTVFCTDPEADKTAKGRTGGCARELFGLLEEMK